MTQHVMQHWLCRKIKQFAFIPMFTLEEIEQYTIQNKKNFGTLKEAIYSRKIIDKNHLYSDTILGKKIWDNLLGDTPSKTNIYFSPEGNIPSAGYRIPLL